MNQVHDISFEEILPIWKKYLWPNKNNIKPINTWKKNPKGYPYNHGLHKPWSFNKLITDKSIESQTPYFFGIYEKDILVAVNSGYKTDDEHFRSRGLYVLPEYRNRGYGKTLLNHVIHIAYASGSDICWTVPRKDALPCYESCGFEMKGTWFHTDFSVSCYAELDLNKL